MRLTFFYSALILAGVALLYGGFLGNPPLFDDLYFFLPGRMEGALDAPYFGPRRLAYASLALQWQWQGESLVALRLGNLLLHAAVAIALFLMLVELRRRVPDETASTPPLLALLAALIFAMHPAAVYGAGYLIQRTIVLATLFSLLSWYCLLRGLRTERRPWLWLWLSVACYAVAILGKEHAVMVPAVNAAMVVWWIRSGGAIPTRRDILALLPVFIGYAVIGVLTVLQTRGLLGSVYEPFAAEMLNQESVAHAWPLSVMTQGFLFFKYLGLWLLPNPLWMSADMREPFATSFTAWPQAPGFVAFLCWPAMGGWLLWKGGRRGLLGLSMLAPWLLFATELASIRIQEIFVLYRSYLWFAPALVALLALEGRLRSRVVLALTVALPLLLFPMAWERLSTFSHHFLLWSDAARLIEARSQEGMPGVTGIERIHRNLGTGYFQIGDHEMAVRHATKALTIKPGYDEAHADRGHALIELKRPVDALRDFDAALRINPAYPYALAGRAKALEALGRDAEAHRDYRIACGLGWPSACEKLPEP